MGEWLTPDWAVMLDEVIGSPAFGVPADRKAALAVALQQTGFLVTTAYYVPNADEMMDMYRELAEVDYHARRNLSHSIVRWVMCGETQIALQRKYGNTRTVHTPSLDAFMSGDETVPLSTVSDELHIVMTTRAAASIPAALDAGRLFDMPIRRDPAARRPMFELIPKEERRP